MVKQATMADAMEMSREPEPQPKDKGVPNPAATKKRQLKRGMTVYVDPAAHEEIKALAGARGGTIEDLWIEGMNLILIKYGKKGIA